MFDTIGKRITVITASIVFVICASVWILGAVKTKSLVKDQLESQNISYEKISILGTPLKYRARIVSPKLEADTPFSPSFEADVAEVAFEMSSDFVYDELFVSFPEGLDINGGMVEANLEGNPEARVKLNKNRDLIRDIHISMPEINITGAESAAKFIVDVENINIPIKADISFLYNNRATSLNNLLFEYEGLSLNLNGFVKLKDEAVNAGWLDFNLKGYESWLDFASAAGAAPAEMIDLIEKVTDKFVVSDVLEEKEIGLKINVIDGEITINGQSSAEIMQEVMEENPELEMIIPMLMSQMSFGMSQDDENLNMQSSDYYDSAF